MLTQHGAPLRIARSVPGASRNTRFSCPDNSTAIGAGTGAIDWNCDNDGGIDTGVMSNINGNGGGGAILTGFNDWPALRLDMQNVGDFEDGVHTFSLPVAEIDEPTALAIPPSLADLRAILVSSTLRCLRPERCGLIAKVQLENIGDAGARRVGGTPPGVAFYLSNDDKFDLEDQLVGTKRFSNIRLYPGGSMTRRKSLSIPFDPSGKYLLIVVDAGRVITESDESNNVLALLL